MSKDGGPAFPTLLEPGNGHEASDQPGMTLRDYFAAKAMAALLGIGDGGEQVALAEEAYEVADAMLEARAK